MFNFLVVDINAISELNAEGIELDENNKSEWLVSRHKSWELAEEKIEKLERKFPNATYDIWEADPV